jgi:hypothetical protein
MKVDGEHSSSSVIVFFVAHWQRKTGPRSLIYNARMHTLTRHWRMRARIAWIACLAILFNALAPLAAHAMNADAPAPVRMTMEVCTAMGMETMSVSLAPDASERADAGKPQKSMSHCGFCVAHATVHGLPPPMDAAFAPALGRDAWPPLYYQSTRALFPWSLAQPRAPPHAA